MDYFQILSQHSHILYNYDRCTESDYFIDPCVFIKPKLFFTDLLDVTFSIDGITDSSVFDLLSGPKFSVFTIAFTALKSITKKRIFFSFFYPALFFRISRNRLR